MTLSHLELRNLIRQLEQEHGAEQGVLPLQQFVFAVLFDDGAEYQLRWPRGARNPVWEVSRER